MEVTLFTPLLAFAAGLLSCVSPCVLPLLPAYVGNLSGVVAGSAKPGRSRTLTLEYRWVPREEEPRTERTK